MRTCARCKGSIEGRHGNARFCSKECLDATKRRGPFPKTCDHCESPYLARNRRQRFCSEDCQCAYRPPVPPTTPATRETCEWLEGPKFMEWLEATAPESIAMIVSSSGGSTRYDPRISTYGRRFTDWRQPDALANYYTVDDLLQAIGLHMSMVPDEAFTNRTPHTYRSLPGGGSITPELRKAVVEAQGGHAEVARRFGVTSRTVQNWRKKAAA